jgi:hypothetical protein
MFIEGFKAKLIGEELAKQLAPLFGGKPVTSKRKRA